MEPSSFEVPLIIEADLGRSDHASDALDLIRGYARDPFGQGRDLELPVRDVLIERLRDHPGALVVLGYLSGRPVGIAVCFTGFSTFAARPLINIHDVYVDPAARGQGVAGRLLEAVESRARAMGCCKLTLEVQERNVRARSTYERFGFAEGVYEPGAGRVLFRWKPL